MKRYKMASREYHSYEASIPSELAIKLQEEVAKRGKGKEPIILANATPRLLRLTPSEAKLFEMLKKVVGEKAELRVAGGWVRDKLLGLASGDIDISVDTMSGVALSKMLENYLHSLGEEELKEVNRKPEGEVEEAREEEKEESRRMSPRPPNISITKLNPQQSKHLETAILTLYGLELNFAQLRTDVYDAKSRIPQIRTGAKVAPLQDALRRDFTINSLFYNIMTDSLEDFTSRGIIGLVNKVIETPLAPLETLKDDPLRALRAIRFAARFGFSLHPLLHKCISDPSVHLMLLTKVTPPRIGTEIQKMLSPALPHLLPHQPALFLSQPTLAARLPNNPLQALHILVDSDLHIPVFNTAQWHLDPSASSWSPDLSHNGLLLAEYLHYIYELVDEERAGPIHAMPSPLARSALLAFSFLTPLLGVTYKDLHKRSTKARPEWLENVKSSLQYPLSHIFFAAQAISDAQSLPSIIDDMLQSQNSSPAQGQSKAAPEMRGDSSHSLSSNDKSSNMPSNKHKNYSEIFEAALENESHRERLGLWLRNAPPLWRTLVLLSKPLRADKVHQLKVPESYTANWLLEAFEVELGLVDAIEKSGLERAREMRPFFNGHDLSHLLNLAPGPSVGDALKRQIAYQVVHAGATKEEVKQMLLATCHSSL